MTALEAEKLVLQAGFQLLRSEGSHRIYGKDKLRLIIPFPGTKILHPKIVKQILKAIEPDAF